MDGRNAFNGNASGEAMSKITVDRESYKRLTRAYHLGHGCHTAVYPIYETCDDPICTAARADLAAPASDAEIRGHLAELEYWEHRIGDDHEEVPEAECDFCVRKKKLQAQLGGVP